MLTAFGRTRAFNKRLVCHKALPYNCFLEFIEASAFTKYVYDYLSEDEYQVCRVIWSKLRNQAKSFLGLAESEKIRWAISGRGKSGGVRVIYYFKKQDHEIWLLTIDG